MGCEYQEKIFPIEGKTADEQINNLLTHYQAYWDELESDAIEQEAQWLLDENEDYIGRELDDVIDEVASNKGDFELYSYTGTFLSAGEGVNILHETIFNPKDFKPGNKWEEPNAQRVIDSEKGESYWIVGAYCSS